MDETRKSQIKTNLAQALSPIETRPIWAGIVDAGDEWKTNDTAKTENRPKNEEATRISGYVWERWRETEKSRATHCSAEAKKIDRVNSFWCAISFLMAQTTFQISQIEFVFVAGFHRMPFAVHRVDSILSLSGFSISSSVPVDIVGIAIVSQFRLARNTRTQPKAKKLQLFLIYFMGSFQRQTKKDVLFSSIGCFRIVEENVRNKNIPIHDSV